MESGCDCFWDLVVLIIDLFMYMYVSIYTSINKVNTHRVTHLDTTSVPAAGMYTIYEKQLLSGALHASAI